jgi:hypothetical protein
MKPSVLIRSVGVSLLLYCYVVSFACRAGSATVQMPRASNIPDELPPGNLNRSSPEFIPALSDALTQGYGNPADDL